LRKGEAIGQQWPAVDLEHGTLLVCQALQRLKLPGEKGRLGTTEPKRRSRRTIDVPQVCLLVLRSHRSRQEERQRVGATWRETGFVFTSRIGTPLDPRKVDDEFREIVDKGYAFTLSDAPLQHCCLGGVCTRGS